MIPGCGQGHEMLNGFFLAMEAGELGEFFRYEHDVAQLHQVAEHSARFLHFDGNG